MENTLTSPLFLKMVEDAKVKDVSRVIMTSIDRIAGSEENRRAVKDLLLNTDVVIETMDGAYQEGTAAQAIARSVLSRESM